MERSRHSLGGNQCLTEDPVSELRSDRGGRYELNPAAEQLTKLALQSYLRTGTNRRAG
jgi:hypothetical protein